MSYFIIIICIILLIILTYLKINVLIVAPLAATLLAVLSGVPVISSLAEFYGPGVATFVGTYFLTFVTSAIFGKVMEDTGMAIAIAKALGSRFGSTKLGAILCVYFTTCLLTYGGVSLFCVVFAVFPIGLALFREANVSRHVIPGCVIAGCGTWSFATMPGSPQAAVIIASNALGTTPGVAPLLGIILTIIFIIIHIIIFALYNRNQEKKGIGFEKEPEILEIAGKFDNRQLPNVIISILPMIVIIILLNVVQLDIVGCMVVGIILALALGWKYIQDDKLNMFNVGASNGIVALINTAAVIGFGSMVKAMPAFEVVKEGILNLTGDPVLVFAIATTCLAGATASGTGGLSLSLETLAPSYLAMGVPPAVLHRVALASCVGLDSLPHNGAIFSCFSVCKSDHRNGYALIFFQTVFASLVVIVFAVILSKLLYM